MGVLKILSTFKSTNAEAETAGEEPASSPSPAVSISSYDSGSLLIHGHQPKLVNKKKHVTWVSGRKHVPAKLANIIWSGLFLMVVIATVIVVAALAENIRRTMWTKVSYRNEDSSLQSISNTADDLYPQSGSGSEDKTCVHRRIMWEHGSQSSEIIHDMRSKWSAIVDHDQERCLIFDLRNARHNGCPIEYPWDMDLHVGIPACRGPLAVIAPIRKIMHHICSEQHVNLTITGEIISSQCFDHRILQVDKVIIQYFDRNFRRIARRSVLNHEQSNSRVTIKPPHESDTVDSTKPSPAAADAINSEKKHSHTSTMWPKEASKTFLKDFKTSKQSVVGSSEVAAQDVSSKSASPSKTHRKQTSAADTSSEISHLKDMIPILVNTIIHSNVNGVLSGDVKQKLSESRMLGDDGGSPDKNDYWEVIYNYVDDAGNIIRARNFEEVKLGRK